MRKVVLDQVIGQNINRWFLFSLGLCLSMGIAFSILLLLAFGMGRSVQASEYDGEDLGEITIVGNGNFEREILIDALDYEDSFWSREFSQKKWDDALLRLESFYLAQGYADYELLGAELNWNEEKKELDISVVVYEGRQYRIWDVQINGLPNHLRQDEDFFMDLMAKIGYHKGQAYDERQLNGHERFIAMTLTQYGFRTAKVASRVSMREKWVTVLFIVEAKELWIIDGVQFLGHKTIKDFVLANEMELSKGSIYNSKQIQQSVDNLYSTGLFRIIDVKERELVKDPKEGNSKTLTDETAHYLKQKGIAHSSLRYVKLLFYFTESEHHTIGFGVGYETYRKTYGLVLWETRNAFSRGATLRAEFSGSENEKIAKLIYSERHLFVKNLLVTTRPFWREKVYREKKLADYSFQTVGLENRFLYPLWPRVEINAGYDIYYHFKIYFQDNVEETVEQPNDSDTLGFEKYNEHVLSAGITYNSRDDYFNPTQGWYSYLGNEIHLKIDHTDYNFFQISYSLAYYQSLLWGFILAPSVGAGVMIPFQNGTTILLIDRFEHGEHFRLRGYPYQRFGPTNNQGDFIGGDRYYFGKLELRSAYFYYFQLVLFGDWGNLFLEEWQSQQPAFTPGLGLRVKTPIGPLRVDVGFVPKTAHWYRSATLSFGLGQHF